MKISQLIKYFFPENLIEDQDIIRKHGLFISINFITAIFGLLYGVLSYFIHFEVGVYTMAFSFLFFITLPFLLRAGIKLKKLSYAFGFYTIALNAILVYYSGGLFISPVTPWIIITSPIILIFTDLPSAIFFTILCVLYVLVFTFEKVQIVNFPFTYDSQYHLMFLTIALSGLVVILFMVTNTFERTKNNALNRLLEKQKELENEKERSENLLLNIFPSEIAEELKSNGKAEAKQHELVTVLFADIVNFTKIAEKLSPTELVAELDYCFSKFDTIVSEHHLEKVKTIGDAYMAAAGVPATNTATAEDAVLTGLAMQKFAQQRKLEKLAIDEFYFEFRVGIHTGPVVAGVVGNKKFVYDIWGDTVNLAARMQQAGETSRVNISEHTHQLVKHKFNCSSRGKLEAKHKGVLEMFFVDSRLSKPMA
ncbi:MAG: adenylate/guanylate cyclase domain-containing protein [Bacteroidetes bacterium]|nr:adenylate/guanylate cyclase domain-containing protein [Bacteroidota bacterium]MBK7108177.1 adenylate/guanylate cyclase domain-containing protein [Bacteroidota bacterium]MBK8486393.1 adenylate/guanylate cyclase domain-containing protein [Bacteroidota bacterium]MBK8683173.1 adenylate/guanylate cyclase domain-containing protein [Bacteroidota bacterium]MBP9190499.1 adenylate/guanylate cyclase domain-containing protein [Chitinophagales bacterium]